MLAEVVDAKVFYANDRSARKPRLEATVTDRRGYLTLTFFGQSRLISYWQSALQPGSRGIFAGKVGEFNRKLQLAHPDFVDRGRRGRVVGGAQRNAGAGPGCADPPDRALPADRQAADLDGRRVRRAGAGHLAGIEDPLPAWIRERRAWSTWRPRSATSTGRRT